MTFWKPKHKPILFVFAEAYRHTGSTVMRGEQLSQLAKVAMPSSEIRFTTLNPDLSNSILFLTKGALHSLDIDSALKLKAKGNVLIFDPVDSPPPLFTKDAADILAACSGRAYDAYRQAFPQLKVVLIDHHVDLRLKGLRFQEISRLSAGYFGELANTFSSRRVEQVVDFIEVTNAEQSGWIQRLPKYNLHYAIRVRSNPKRYKPFLKGFTAAYCQSNILVQADENDVERWLGADYPYLFRGEVSEQSIIKALHQIEETFGGAEWMLAQARMQEVKERISDEAIMVQLRSLFKSIKT